MAQRLPKLSMVLKGVKEPKTMGEDVRQLLHFAQGPLFRFAFALLVLGLIRSAWISFSAASAAYFIIGDRGEFWRRMRLRIRWHIFPTSVVRELRGERSGALEAYHRFLTCVSIVFRVGVLLIPAFMVAHVYLWERLLGAAWPSIPARISDVLSVVTLLAGVGLFLGRIYSPLIRSIDPPWAFLKPLILLVPFLSGMLAMHPTWSPAEYHVTMLIHVVSAAVVFIMIPFARMLSFLHRPIEAVLPELAWPDEGDVPVEEETAPGDVALRTRNPDPRMSACEPHAGTVRR